MLFGLAVFGFGIGVGLEWTGLGWGLLPVATVLIALAFALAMGRTRGPAPTRPPVTMDAAEAVPKLQIGAVPVIGVVAWTSVVLVSLRFQLRR